MLQPFILIPFTVLGWQSRVEVRIILQIFTIIHAKNNKIITGLMNEKTTTIFFLPIGQLPEVTL